MEKIKFDLNKYKEKKKTPKYRFQEICLELSEVSGVNKGLCFALWKRRGSDVERILAEIKQGEVKNPEIYIKYLLKNNNKKDE